MQVLKCCQLEPKVIIIASCVLVPVIVTALGAAVIIVVVVVFHIVVASWTEYQRARLKIEKLRTCLPLWRNTGVNNDKEGET